MGVKLVDLKLDRRTLTVDIPVGDAGATEPLTVTYRPSAYTGKTEQEFNAMLKDEWKSRMGLEFVARLVTAWDLEGEDGQVYPIDVDSLSDLPQNFIGAVIKGVADDMGKALAS